MRLRFILTCLVLTGTATGPGLAAEEAPTLKNTRTVWFRDAHWGVFTHYMADTVLQGATVDTWNEAVNSFDVNALAVMLKAVGAGYYVITLGQNSGFYCSPNATYDQYVGIAPSKCSTRDLVADLYEALHPKGIRLMVYLPSGAPDRDEAAMKALEWKSGKHPLWDKSKVEPGDEDARLESFQRKWEEVIREWSVRWGKKVSGWWFDGCYFPDAMYRHAEPPNFESFAAAARAGNPDSLVAFNPGVNDPIISLTPFEDYTAGEINEPEKVKCPGRWVNSVQFHMLSYLGPQWAQSPPRFQDEQVITIARNIVKKGGVVTWDVPISSTGAIPQPFVDQLTALGKALKPNPKGEGSHGAGSPIRPGGKSYGQRGQPGQKGPARGAGGGVTAPRRDRLEERITPQQPARRTPIPPHL